MADEGLSPRELMMEIRSSIKEIEKSLDTKVDLSRFFTTETTCAELKGRLDTLEAQMVKRNGPIVNEIREYEKKLDSVLTEQRIQREIAKDLREKSTSVWNKSNIVVGLFISFVVLAANFLPEIFNK